MLSRIYALIQRDLARVEDSLREVSKVDFPWLSQMLDYSLGGGGKRIRPALTLLSGRFYDYDMAVLQSMATAVELLHTATLVHDDAIDKSQVRRGRPTINSLWGEEKAILLGDYLFAKAGEFATDTGSLRVVRSFTQTLGIISRGELEQTYNAFNLNQTRDDYLCIIAHKTASLFALATESGAVLSRAPEEMVGALRDYGHNLGVAFQIVDDVLDFAGTEEEIGKPVGSDLAQGTLTLPAILLLEHYPGENPVSSLFNRDEDRDKSIGRALEMVKDSPIVEECVQLALDYCARACHSLELLPDGDKRQTLIELAGFIAKRRS